VSLCVSVSLCMHMCFSVCLSVCLSPCCQCIFVSLSQWEQEPAHPEAEQPDSKMENLDLKEKIEQALENLKPHFREIIILKHFQQLKFREIAEITKTPESTLKARFHRGIEQLKKHLDPMEFSDAA